MGSTPSITVTHGSGRTHVNVETQANTWLILSGSTDPPSYVNAQFEKEDVHSDSKEDGKYISQIIKNVQIVEHYACISWVSKYVTLSNRYSNMQAKRSDAFNQIEDLCKKASNKPQDNGKNYVYIYYTGHGSNGDWCFNDGIITLKNIINIANKYKKVTELNIYSQCCGSGDWCVELEKYKYKTHLTIAIFASSRPGCVSYGNNNGSTWTRFLFNSERGYARRNQLKWTSGVMEDGKYVLEKMDYEHLQVGYKFWKPLEEIED
eukprot:515444_1